MKKAPLITLRSKIATQSYSKMSKSIGVDRGVEPSIGDIIEPILEVQGFPSGLALEQVDNEITLTWNDGSTNEDAILIERSLNGESFVGINVIAANTTSYVDDVTGIEAENIYYRVTAIKGHFGKKSEVLLGTLLKHLPFTVIGKNKFDKSTITTGYEMNASTGALSAQALSAVSDFISIDDGVGMLGCSGKGVSTYNSLICWYDSNQTFLGADSWLAANSNQLILVFKNAKYLRFDVTRRGGLPATGLNTIQIENWNITTYSDYSSSTVRLPVDANNNPFLLTPGKNKFSPQKYLPGYEIYIGGVIQAYATSAAMYYTSIPSDAIFMYLSGFQDFATETTKGIGFYTSTKTFISRSTVGDNTHFIVPIPANAAYFTLTLYGRVTSGETKDLSTYQVEFYGETEFEAYIESLQNRLLFPKHDVSTWGKTMICAGDSIMETSTDWTLDGVTYTELGRDNWPTYAAGRLKVSKFKNYAASGAAWKNGVQTEKQKILNQITTAISHAGFTPDIIVINGGTNDGIANLGSFATAMSKATLGDLDKTIFYEALRWGMWTLKNTWPDAKCFLGDVLPRSSNPESYYVDVNTAIQEMANQYGYIYVDQTGAGINTTTDLSDGLHPNHAGSIKLSSFWTNIIKANF